MQIATKRKTPKRKTPKRKTHKRKSPKRKSTTHKTPKRKTTKRRKTLKINIMKGGNLFKIYLQKDDIGDISTEVKLPEIFNFKVFELLNDENRSLISSLSFLSLVFLKTVGTVKTYNIFQTTYYKEPNKDPTKKAIGTINSDGIIKFKQNRENSYYLSYVSQYINFEQQTLMYGKPTDRKMYNTYHIIKN
jgi:hypothetical protein